MNRDDQFTPKVPPEGFARRVLRRLTRRWGRIAFLWCISSALLTLGIYTYLRRTYQAFSLVRVEPNQPDLFGRQPRNPFGDPRSAEPYLRTQATLITSDGVLQQAVADPNVVVLPTIKRSVDARSEPRKSLAVEIVPDTYLIRVALESPAPREAATIVNAVVDAYFGEYQRYILSANRPLKEGLKIEIAKLDVEITKKKTQLRDLATKGTFSVVHPDRVRRASNDADAVPLPKVRTAAAGPSDTLLGEQTKGETNLKPGARGEAPIDGTQELYRLQKRIADLEQQVERGNKLLEQLLLERNAPSNDSVLFTCLTHELNSLLNRQEQVIQNLAQVGFESKQDQFRVALLDRAAVPKVAITDRRFAYTVKTWGVVLLLLLASFALIPLRGESIASTGAQKST